MATTFQAPKGTRDFYPEDLLRRRYIVEQWRAASVRHGFEEIDGPTFEHAELYTVKSGEGILSELFSFTREGGEDLYALRPEFTPTLARLYAARASSLPSPVRWFCIPNFFRAEKPQRGRLREFGQWNCDVIGGDRAVADAELISCMLGLMEEIGLDDRTIRLRTNHRDAALILLESAGIEPSEPYKAGQSTGGGMFSNLHRVKRFTEQQVQQAMLLLDKRDKLAPAELIDAFVEIGADRERVARFLFPEDIHDFFKPLRVGNCHWNKVAQYYGIPLDDYADDEDEGGFTWLQELEAVKNHLSGAGLLKYMDIDYSVVRGLAYYTGTVFEVLAKGERAVAGGGRYDKLIELFGGPPTPACGFGMGDAVLAHLMDDHGLFPQGHELRDAIDRVVRGISLRPEVFVVSGGEDTDELVAPLLARLRRGTESESFRERGGEARPWDEDRYRVRPLHARTTGKATRNLKKLLAEAEKLGAKTAAIIHGPDKVQLKDLRTRDDIGDFAIKPDVSNALGDVPYVGEAISGRV